MCRVDTERFFYLCGHSQWIETRGDALCGNCDKANAYRMQLWNNHLCPNCRPPDEENPEEDGPMPQTEAEEEAWMEKLVTSKKVDNERFCFLRRSEARKRAIKLYQRARVAKGIAMGLPGGIGYGEDPSLMDVNTHRVPRGTLPLDFMPDTHLIDDADFTSPKLKIVPPGTIPEDSDKCSLCWGSLGIEDDGEGLECEGGGARMVPCGHIYGTKCIKDVFARWSMCPSYTREFRVKRAPSRRFVEATLESLFENPELHRGWLAARTMLLSLLSPVVLAAALTMNVGHRLHPNGPFKRVSLPIRMLILLPCIVGSPIIYAYFISRFVIRAIRLRL